MDWIPKINYTGGVDLIFTLPMGLSVPVHAPIGGGDRAASRIPEVFIRRRDNLRRLWLRGYTSEWAAVRAWIEATHDAAASFTFWPDVAVPGTSYACYLEEPGPGQRFEPTPDAEFTDAWGLSVLIMSTDGTPIEFIHTL